MKVAVTGATGFVGTRLVRRLCAAGDDVRALVAAGEDPDELRGLGVEIASGDVRERATVDGLLRDRELVYHLAGLIPGRSRRVADYVAVNIGGTANVARAAAELGVRHLVHCSTVSVHGVPRVTPADEDAPLAPRNVYGVTKAAGERAVQACVRDAGLSAVIARPTALYGPGDARGVRLYRDVARGRLVMLGSGRPRCHLGHVDDVVSGLLLCGAHRPSRGEVFIIGGAEHPTVAELIAEIAAACGVRLRTLRLPAAPVAAAGRLVGAWRDPARALSGFFDRADFFLAERTYTIDRARRVLGFEPRTTLRAGIRETVAWYRAESLL